MVNILAYSYLLCTRNISQWEMSTYLHQRNWIYTVYEKKLYIIIAYTDMRNSLR